MGALLVRSGREVVGFDIVENALKAATNLGVAAASGIHELCERSDLVITCVTDGAALKEVVCGAGGLATHLKAGSPVVDTTSAEPWISREVAAVLAERGIPFLDAPVSGGVPAAESGRMNFMVGGDRSLLDTLRPVFAPLGPVVTHVGDVGSGHTIKAVNMLALASSMLATAELISICADTHDDLERLVDSLDAGPGASYSTRVHYPRFVVPGNYASGFTFDLMLKDLLIAIDLANRLGVPLFLLRSVFEAYRRGANLGMRGQDNTLMVRFGTGRTNNTPTTIDAQTFGLTAAGFNAVIAGEAMMLGVAAGLEPHTIVEVLSSGSGDSTSLRDIVGKGLDGARSDVRLGDVVEAHASLLQRALGDCVPSPLLSQSWAINLSAQQARGPDADMTSLTTLLEGWCGQRSTQVGGRA